MAARRGVKQYRFEGMSFHDKTGRIIKRTTKLDRAKRLLREVTEFDTLRIWARAYSYDGRGRLASHEHHWKFDAQGREIYFPREVRDGYTAAEVIEMIETTVADGEGGWVTPA